MSGHSKWSSIKNKKGAADAKRGKIFSKLAKAITIAARDGGADLSANFTLRLVVDKAKQVNMPKDNIDRAIARGDGSDTDQILSTVLYEGMGPGGVSMLIESLTDNKNRALTEIKTIFNKNGGNLGAKVLWQFERFGVVRVKDASSISNRDEFEMMLIDAGAEDMDWEDGLEVTSHLENLQKVEKAISATGLVVTSAEPEYIAKDTIQLSEVEEARLVNLIELLDDNDDVGSIYTNAK